MSRANRRRKRRAEPEQDSEASVWEARQRYWLRRYRLFNLFDLGVQMDEVAWYSVTPEAVARHHAMRCAVSDGTVIDACCGVGGNAIALARTCARVVAVDLDPVRLDMARHNAQVYDIPPDRIAWLCQDFLLTFPALRGLKAGGVFLSPPWGGPGYRDHAVLPLSAIRGEEFWAAARALSRNVAMFLPRNVDVESLRALGEPVEVESNYLNDRCIAITAYWGDWASFPP